MGTAPLGWQACAECGRDVLAPADVTVTCWRCVGRAAAKETI